MEPRSFHFRPAIGSVFYALMVIKPGLRRSHDSTLPSITCGNLHLRIRVSRETKEATVATFR